MGAPLHGAVAALVALRGERLASPPTRRTGRTRGRAPPSELSRDPHVADRPASAWRVVRSPPDGSFAAQLHPPSRRWRSWTAFANDSLFPSCFSDETKRGTTVARRRSDLAGTRARRSQQQPPRPGSVVNAGSWSPRGRGKRRAQMGCGGTGGAAGGKGRQRWRDGAWDKRLRSRRRVAAGERRGPSGATPVGVPSLPAAVRGQAGTPRALCVPACLFWLQGAAVGLTGQRADEREGFAAAATDDAVDTLPVSPDANGMRRPGRASSGATVATPTARVRIVSDWVLCVPRIRTLEKNICPDWVWKGVKHPGIVFNHIGRWRNSMDGSAEVPGRSSRGLRARLCRATCNGRASQRGGGWRGARAAACRARCGGGRSSRSARRDVRRSPPCTLLATRDVTRRPLAAP